MKRYTAKDEEELRRYVPCEEDRMLLTTGKWGGGYRWFRDPRIIPLEHWRRPKADVIQQPRTAA